MAKKTFLDEPSRPVEPKELPWIAELRHHVSSGPFLQSRPVSTFSDSLHASVLRSLQELMSPLAHRPERLGPHGEPSLRQLLLDETDAAKDGDFRLSPGARLLQAFYGPEACPQLPPGAALWLRSLLVTLTLLERIGRRIFAVQLPKPENEEEARHG